MALVKPGKFVFVHVPKTGGTWIKTVLRSQLGGTLYTKTNHGNVWAKAGHPDLLDLSGIDGFRFGFVRHPVDWWLSFWRHRQRRGRWNPELGLDKAVRAKTLDEYVRNILTRKPGFVGRMFTSFLGAPGREIDFIGKQERFDEDLRTALRMIGYDPDKLDLSANRKNVGGARTEHFHFTPEQRRALSEAEAEAIERFGYEPWH